jgi:hypothetical protein
MPYSRVMAHTFSLVAVCAVHRDCLGTSLCRLCLLSTDMHIKSLTASFPSQKIKFALRCGRIKSAKIGKSRTGILAFFKEARL